MAGIYIISHPKHASLWRKYSNEGFPICSSWIWETAELDRGRYYVPIWINRISEIRTASCAFVYSCVDDLPPFGIVEVGMCLSEDINTYSLGSYRFSEQFKSVDCFIPKPWPEFDILKTLQEAHGWDKGGINTRKARNG